MAAHKRGDWTTPTTPEIAYRRAAGRRRYNAERQLNARMRRLEVWELLLKGGRTYQQIGAKLGVSETTIYRDVRSFKTKTHWICPTCRTLHFTGIGGIRPRFARI